jgi:hypothetical protein
MNSFETTIWLADPVSSPAEIEVRIDYETQQVNEHNIKEGFEAIETYCFVQVERGVWVEILQTNLIKNQIDTQIQEKMNPVCDEAPE